jgi:hypothetical protein
MELARLAEVRFFIDARRRLRLVKFLFFLLLEKLSLSQIHLAEAFLFGRPPLKFAAAGEVGKLGVRPLL